MVRYMESKIDIMKQPKDTIISLTGGLGNQLFQLALGLSVADGGKLSLEWSLGKPRLNQANLPEIASFRLPENVSLDRGRESNWLVGKSTGYMLRMGFDPKGLEKREGVYSIFRWLASIVISTYFRSFRIIHPARKLGYHLLSSGMTGNFIVGYFQSYKWAATPDVLKSLQRLKIAEESPALFELSRLSVIERPLIVHIRLGDYKSEDSFGVLPNTYYEKSIKKMWESGDYKKIWAFSDEPELARQFLTFVPRENLRWISQIDNSASKTLEAMRYGRGYVIGNSTYSWWGAFLSFTPNARVIAPKPWFRTIPSPQELIPPHWDFEVSW
jgi:hypothetical protein